MLPYNKLSISTAGITALLVVALVVVSPRGSTIDPHGKHRQQMEGAVNVLDVYDLPRSKSIWSQAQKLAAENSKCQGKERVLYTLLRMGLPVPAPACHSLPAWSEVVDLYGDEPVIYGLERCESYRTSLTLQGNAAPTDPTPRVTGLINTGTNAMEWMLNNNFATQESKNEYQLKCQSKHAPLSLKQNMTDNGSCKANPLYRFLPIVMVRDPFRWMRATCKLPYDLAWKRGIHGRCPNLVPTGHEKSLSMFRNIRTFNVSYPFRVIHGARVEDVLENQTAFYVESHDSLIDMWSEWNRQYFDTTIPRLIIRMEDMLFHPEKVMKSIVDCLGGDFHEDDIQFPQEKIKPEKRSSTLLQTIMEAGHESGRYQGLTEADFQYLREHADLDMMEKLHYKVVISGTFP